LSEGGANLFGFSALSFGSYALNNSTNPYGTGTDLVGAGGSVSAPGVSFRDPAYQFVNPDSIAGARVIGACMRVVYVGTAANRSGEFSFISNLGVQQLMKRDGKTSSIEELFNYGAVRERTRDLEIVYRPDIGSEFPRKTGERAQSAGEWLGVENPGIDTPFLLAVPGGPVRTKQVPSSQGEVKGIGIAWTGLNPSVGVDVYIELTKIIQYKYEPHGGVVESSQHAPSPVFTQTSAEAVNGCDAKLPANWDVRESGTGSMSVPERIFGGLKQVYDSSFGQAAMEAASSTIGQAAKGYLRRRNRPALM